MSGLLEVLSELLERDAQGAADLVDFDEAEAPFPGLVLADERLRNAQAAREIVLRESRAMSSITEK